MGEMVRRLPLLLGLLLLVALAGERLVVAQVASDAAHEAPAAEPMQGAPAAAADPSSAQTNTPALAGEQPGPRAGAPRDAAVVPLTPAPAPAPVVVTTPPPAPPVAATPPAADSGPATMPAPVVTAPAPTAPAEDSATAPPADAQAAPVVDVPAMPEPKPVLVETPLPRDRPEISERTIPARLLFAAKAEASRGKPQAIGYYPNGCLAGGVELPEDGPTWQAMRLSRNRNWGHPQLVRFVKRWAPIAAKATGWPGILVGDLGQPRGGPTPFGHRSHQTGLDVDIWFRPMPEHRLSKEERETLSALNLVSDDWKDVNPETWTPAYGHLIRTAAEQPEVERVLVNAAIKKELCRLQGKQNWSWMAKVRPWYAHHDHIHVRLKCPPDSPHCRSQPEVPGGDGCEKSELAHWFSDKVLNPKPKKGGKRKETLLADLPDACKTVLNAPARTDSFAAGEK